MAATFAICISGHMKEKFVKKVWTVQI